MHVSMSASQSKEMHNNIVPTLTLVSQAIRIFPRGAHAHFFLMVCMHGGRSHAQGPSPVHAHHEEKYGDLCSKRGGYTVGDV